MQWWADYQDELQRNDARVIPDIGDAAGLLHNKDSSSIGFVQLM